MAKKQYLAAHRIMVKAKPPTYLEPGIEFMMEEKDAEPLLKLGACSVVERETTKVPTKKKAPAANKVEEAPVEDDGEEDLVG